MIKFKLLLYIFLILFLLNKFEAVNGQLTLVSTNEGAATAYLLNSDTKFEGYPSQSQLDLCSFTIKIVVYNTYVDGIATLNFGSTLLSDNLYDIIDSNVRVYEISATKINFGKFYSKIDLVSNSLTTSYNLTYTCKEIDLNLLNLKFINDKPSFELINFVSYLSFDKSNDVIQSYFVIDSPAAGSFSYYSGSNNYMILWDLNYVKNNLFNNWTITILYGDSGSITLETKSYYYDLLPLPKPFDYKYYPSQVQDNNSSFYYEQFGYGANPIFTSRILTNDTRPFQIENLVGNWLMSVPLKGRKGDMIYGSKLFYNLPISITPSIVTIISQDGSDLDDFDITVAIQYNQIVPQFAFLSIIVNSQPSNFLISIDCTSGYRHTKFLQNYNGFTLTTQFPFGFHSGTNLNFEYQALYQKSEFMTSARLDFKIQNELPIDTGKSEQVPSTPIPPSRPRIKKYEFIRINQSNKFILRLNIISLNGVSLITCGSKFGLETLISGTIYDGIYELILDHTQVPMSIGIVETFNLGYSSYNLGDFISFNNDTKISNPLNLPDYLNYQVNYDQFVNLTFGNNDLNLVNQSNYNMVYLQSDNLPIDIPLSLLLLDPVNAPYIDWELSFNFIPSDKIFPFQYDENLKLFTCKFIVPKNNIFGEIKYAIISTLSSIIYSSNLPKSAKLLVNDTYLDNQGPIFKNITKIGDNLIVSSSGQIGWQFEITDDYNGFESGYIKVVGSVDNSVYQFNFTMNDALPGSTLWNCKFRIMIPLTKPCYNQGLLISQVILYDTNQVKSEFNLYANTQSIKNPFINFYGEESSLEITQIDYTCSSSTAENITPTLSAFSVSSTTIDVGSRNRSITFTFTLTLQTSSLSIGLKNDQTPSVFLLGSRMELWECKSKLLGIDSGANYNYSCTTELPVGFGYPGSLLLSIYGIISNGGYYSGFTSSELVTLGFSSLISTTLSLDQPVITGTDSIYSDGGTLVIYGRSLSLTSDKLLIKYSDQDTAKFEETPIIFQLSSTLVINVRATTKQFTIKYVGLNNIESNEFIVTPIYFNYVGTPPTPSPTVTITPTISPTLPQTPTPTNTPLPPKCQGNPECGGSDKGTCTSSGSCQCISPWTGITCQDRVIVIPKPEPNPNNPSNNLTLPGSTIGEISILSIRELNFNHVVIKTHQLNQWKLTKLDENRNQYTINITSGSSTSTQIETTITVITEWFDKLETITFANQELVMNPSTLKYYINITSYSFENTLNNLQLVIQSKAINNQDSGCSSQSYGDSVNDDSNYVQLSVDQHSLYGRFIKRGIIDNKLVVIENKQLNDFKTESNYHQTESYIGISIPYYNDVVQLDPDFSLLLNLDSANSVCKNNKSSLSKGALIGIVIGTVGGAIIITVIALILIKYKYQIRNFKPSITLKNLKNK